METETQNVIVPNKRSRRVLVVCIIAVIAASVILVAFFPNINGIRARAKLNADRVTLAAIEAALQQYRADWGAFPPDNVGSLIGGKVLYGYLCQPVALGKVAHGPYMTTTPGETEIRSVFGGELAYRVLLSADGKPTGFLVISPGPDGMLGGTIDPQKGFVPDGTLNADGVRADEDNIYGASP